MNFHHHLACEQLQGLREQEWPEPPDDEDARDRQERRVWGHINSAAEVGQFLALLAISETLIGINHTLSGIEAILGAQHMRPSIGLSSTLIPREGSMSVIKPITVPVGNSVLFKTDYKNAGGTSVTPPSPLLWVSSNPAVIALTVAPDSLSAIGVRGVDGDATIDVSDPSTDGAPDDSEVCTVKSLASINLTSQLVVNQ